MSDNESEKDFYNQKILCKNENNANSSNLNKDKKLKKNKKNKKINKHDKSEYLADLDSHGPLDNLDHFETLDNEKINKMTPNEVEA